MEDQRRQILAIVTTNHKDVVSGSVPIFLAKDEGEREKLSKYISRVLGGSAHDLENGIYIIVG